MNMTAACKKLDKQKMNKKERNIVSVVVLGINRYESVVRKCE